MNRRERHQALITVHVGPLIDGHGEVALAEQGFPGCFAFRDRPRHALFVKPGASANLVGRSKIDNQHPDRTVTLRLQDKTPVDLQR